jgi:excisionase family DNA binding protein
MRSLGARGETPRCAICSVDPDTGRPGTNATTRICERCRTDPANRGWASSPVDLSERERGSLSVDHAIRDAVRETVREVVREEVRSAIREEIAAIRDQLTERGSSERYLSVEEAARHANVHPATIRGWIRSGALPGRRAGRHHRVRCSDLEAHLASLPKTAIDLDARAAELAQE